MFALYGHYLCPKPTLFVALEHDLCSAWDTICVWVTIFVIFKHYLLSRWDAICARVTLFGVFGTICAMAALFVPWR